MIKKKAASRIRLRVIVAQLEGGAWILTVKGALLTAKTTENGF